MDIDRLILLIISSLVGMCFSSLMDIDRLIPQGRQSREDNRFSSLMDIDRLIRTPTNAARP